ncbi:MarR family winged helix-turn-helix transcriptional regulator [Microvirga arsenatis]|uniref:MarR family transcriptional regulator n=1 Tax=Microvirga arsenatis TaxID=2692265 RepID=A0ABW9YS54_9HYPH|nr:MarR family transcriptional regulator [Microvirga arsenatis]NBJ09812.1 MarR family transcriptional regulator [Microvirga arsenatis]NBJ22880.1 MarR family transcriptional regulator [Microvirga arsenatis]
MAAGSAAKKRVPEPLVVLEEFLPYRLNVLAGLTSSALAQIYAERFGLSIPAWRVIVTLGQYEHRTARDMAPDGVMHKSTVSRAVSALEKRGLVVRRPNLDDRREELLALTPAGRAIYEAVAPQALAVEERLLSVLSPQEQRTLSSLIDRLTRQARQLAPHGSEEDEA